MRFDLQLQLLAIYLLIAFIRASSNDDSDTWESDSDGDSDVWRSNSDRVPNCMIEVFQKPSIGGLGRLPEETVGINRQTVQNVDEQRISETDGFFEGGLIIDLQKIDLSDQTSELSSKFNIWQDLIKFFRENIEKESIKEMMAKLKILLAKCLEQPDKAGKYPNEKLEFNLSFGIQYLKLILLAIFSEHDELLKRRETVIKYPIKENFEDDLQIWDLALENVEKALWQLGLIICALNMVEEIENLHDCFNQLHQAPLKEALLTISKLFQKTHKYSESDANLYLYIFKKAIDFAPPTGELGELLSRLVYLWQEETSESTTINVKTRNAKLTFHKTISRHGN